MLDPQLSQATELHSGRSLPGIRRKSADQHRVRDGGNTLGGIALLFSSCCQNLNLCSSCLPLLSAIGLAWLRWWKERWSVHKWIAALVVARAGQQSAKQRLVNSVVLTVVDVRRLTAESFQHRQYTKAMNLKLLPMWFGNIVIGIAEKIVLQALDVRNPSFSQARDANDVSDVSV